MNCCVHPEAEAVGTCTACGRAMCANCAVDVRGKLTCRHCLASRPLPTDKDPNTAFLLELLPGLIGFLGIGYMYVGRTNDGVLRLVLWFVGLAVAWVITAVLAAVVVGIACIPLVAAAQIGVPIWSAITLKNELTKAATP
jgi:hypothetical protein